MNIRFLSMRSFWITTCILVVSVSALASAGDVYVAQGPLGAADGGSCASARAVSFFNAAGNWGAGTAQIGPGTVVHICGTITVPAGGTAFTFNGSGTSGSPVTLKFETGAVLQAPYFGANNGAIEVSGKSFIVIDGGVNGTIQNTANGTAGSYPNQQGTKGVNLTNASNVEVKNLTIANLYVRTSVNDDGPYDPTNGACIYANGFGDGISIHDNTMHDGPWCVDLQYGTGTNVTSVQIYNNNIYNVPHGIVLGGNGSGTIGTAYIYNNHIHDFSNWGSATGTFHLTGTHLYGQPSSTLATVYYYNNVTDGRWGNVACPNEPGSCITAHLFVEAGSSSSHISNLYVFNNVGVGDVGINNGIFGVFQSSVATKVYNNTLVSADSTRGVCYYSNNSIAGLDFRNNVMTGCNTLIAIQPSVTLAGTSPSYNIYAGGGSNSFICNSNFYNASQFSSWKGCVGGAGDANSFTYASAGLNTSTGAPNVGSVVIGRGATLYPVCNGQASPGLGALCSDRAGIARPASGAWDVGAYQFSNNSTSLVPPPVFAVTSIK